MPKVDFRTVFTVFFYDHDRDFIRESREIDTYQEAETVGMTVAEMSDDIAYFSIERYFKKIVIDDEPHDDIDIDTID